MMGRVIDIEAAKRAIAARAGQKLNAWIGRALKRAVRAAEGGGA